MITMYAEPEGHRLWAVFLSLSLVVLLAPLQLQASDSITGNIENGQAIAARKCDRCHGRGASVMTRIRHPLPGKAWPICSSR